MKPQPAGGDRPAVQPTSASSAMEWPTWTIVLSVAACIWFVWSGFLWKGGARHIDSAFWYVASRCWLAGGSPYDFATFRAAWTAVFGGPAPASFVYPPSTVLVFLPMGAFDWSGARLYFDAVNAVATAVLLGSLASLCRDVPRGRLAIGLALVATNSGLLSTVYTGQTTLLVTAGMALAWAGASAGKSIPLIIGVLLASMKPQFSAPMLVWLALRGPMKRATWIGCALAALTGLLLLIGAHPLEGLHESLAIGVALPENTYAVQFGLGRTLGSIGLSNNTARMLLATGGIAFALVFPTTRGSSAPLSREVVRVSAFLAASFALAPTHAYDLVLVAPVALGILLLKRPAPVAMIAAIVVWRPAVLRVVPSLGAGGQRTAVLVAVLVAVVFLLNDLRQLQPAPRSRAAARRSSRRSGGEARP